MAEFILFALGVFLLGLVSLPNGDTLFINGCPMYGCRPSGSFSFYMDVPRDNVTFRWRTPVVNPVPNALGCVANNLNIVCQSNGVFTEDKGYTVLNSNNGSLLWRESQLTYPPLPILDNYGDVTASDGVSLVHYDADGTKYPVIPVQGLKPVFSISIVGSNVLLLVSERGEIVVRETNGIPIGSLYLSAKIGDQHGTFLPIAQPVADERRLYVLTEFSPSDSSHITDRAVTRLYAIEVFATISDRIKVAWHYEFGDSFLHATNISDGRYDQRLLWDSGNKYVYVNLPYLVSADGNEALPSVFAVRDDGNGTVMFKAALNVTHMARFKPDHCDMSNNVQCNVPNSLVWLALNDSKLLSLNPEGKIEQMLDLKTLFNSPTKLLTKLSIAKKDDTYPENLIFGVELESGLNGPATYLAAIDVTNTSHPLWISEVPGHAILKGQVVASSGGDSDMRDQFIVYAEDRNYGSAAILSFR